MIGVTHSECGKKIAILRHFAEKLTFFFLFGENHFQAIAF